MDDVRVVAIEQYGAGPYGTVHLAELGAEIIKIEDPATGGDVGRYVPPHQVGEDSLFFETFNRDKRSLSLDLATPAGREVFEDLVKVSDAVFSNLRGDLPERLGIRFDDLRHLNPSIVCCSLTGYGTSGPRRSQAGYDYIIQGLTGWMSATGEPEGPPAKSGFSLVDFSSGLVAALALLAGIHAARRDGTGLDCDVSLYETALSMLSYPATWYLTGDTVPTRTARSSHPSLVPFGNFPTSDGWIVLACPKEKFWLRLTEALARPDLAADARYASFETRLAHRGELIADLDRTLKTATTDAWISRLENFGVPCGPVNDVPQALRDPQVAALDMIVETSHPRFGTVRQLRSPVNVGTRHQPRRAPARSEDQTELLTGLLGYDADAVRRLTDNGAFGRPGATTS